MSYYAKLDGDRIVLVAEGTRAPLGVWTDITAIWPGWEARPAPGMHPFLLEGAIVWQDPRSEEQAWADVRAHRDTLLAGCDWTVVRAVEMSATIPTEWSDYRQDLRDITEQADPFDITWPTPPA